MFVAGKASNGLNDDFEIIKLQKSFTSNAVNSFAISKVNYDLNVVPNPAHNNVQITYNMPQAGNAKITLTDFHGRIIQAQTQYNIQGRQFLNMNCHLH